MSDVTHSLALPYLAAAQAQKHVTHNEALRRLDVLVQLTLEGFGVQHPPAQPQNGQVFALAAGATGAWAGHDRELAARIDDAWEFIMPATGWRAYGRGDETLRVWSGTAWVRVGDGTENLAGVGINTTSDSSNRLSVSAAATLLSHEGSDHRLTLNKAAAGDTGSLLFQTGWSGRAEIGLAGGDDLSVKVSADGSVWTPALSVDRNDGRISLPAGVGVGGFLSFGAASGVTIAAGAITVTGSYHQVDTEADAATDDLDTITGGNEGDILILRTTHNGRDVVVRNDIGNIRCGSDRTLSNSYCRITLQLRNGTWCMIAFAEN